MNILPEKNLKVKILFLGEIPFKKWEKEAREEQVEAKKKALLDDPYSMPAYLRTNITWGNPKMLRERMEWELAARQIRSQMVGAFGQRGGVHGSK